MQHVQAWRLKSLGGCPSAVGWVGGYMGRVQWLLHPWPRSHTLIFALALHILQPACTVNWTCGAILSKGKGELYASYCQEGRTALLRTLQVLEATYSTQRDAAHTPFLGDLKHSQGALKTRMTQAALPLGWMTRSLMVLVASAVGKDAVWGRRITAQTPRILARGHAIHSRKCYMSISFKSMSKTQTKHLTTGLAPGTAEPLPGNRRQSRCLSLRKARTRATSFGAHEQILTLLYHLTAAPWESPRGR